MRIAQLWRYPVKSLGGEPLEAAGVDDHGIEGDRRWALEDCATGAVLTARRVPALLFGAARLTPTGVQVDLPAPAGPVTEEALSAWAGRPVRLVRAEPGRRGTYETPVDFEHEADTTWVSWQGPEGSFHDSRRTQLSILSASSVGDWDLRRFRANVVLDAGDERELLGRRIRIGSVEASVVKQIDRCVIVTRPQPGLDADLDVLRRINRERDTFLGVGALVDTPGSVRVGDPVVVL